jgi:hypothetical protein
MSTRLRLRLRLGVRRPCLGLGLRRPRFSGGSLTLGLGLLRHLHQLVLRNVVVVRLVVVGRRDLLVELRET